MNKFSVLVELLEQLQKKLFFFFFKALEPADRKSLVNVTRWFNTCVNQPQFLKVLGKISLCEKMVPVTTNPNAATNATSTAASDAATPDSTPGNGKDVCFWKVFFFYLL